MVANPLDKRETAQNGTAVLYRNIRYTAAAGKEYSGYLCVLVDDELIPAS